ncbi:MAG TPA: hypothetical protein VNF75_08155 [Candidatus Dormibacteraeota bacterium]|nr:hypothetical protein [Candidatus Dormibacteraeota bacterium]
MLTASQPQIAMWTRTGRASVMGERLPPTPTVIAVTAVAAVAQLPLPVAGSWGPQAMFTTAVPGTGPPEGAGATPASRTIRDAMVAGNGAVRA